MCYWPREAEVAPQELLRGPSKVHTALRAVDGHTQPRVSLDVLHLRKGMWSQQEGC